VAVPITPDGTLFAPWPGDAGRDTDDDDVDPTCTWWNGTHYYDPGLCSHFAVTRLSSSNVARAVARANRCAAFATTDCVLSGEIGFSMPAVFVYDNVEGMRMLVAPRLLDVDNATARAVRMQDPFDVHPNQLFQFNDTVRVEYMRGATRTLETRVLKGNNAYCVQTLRRAVVPTCWKQLD
jgi:hypothetical protein